MEQILGGNWAPGSDYCLEELFHSGTLAQTLMSGSFKWPSEAWACIIFNTPD